LALEVCFLIFLALTIPFTASAEKDKWWTELKTKIEKLTLAPAELTTVVGGVRGAKQKSDNDLYWKKGNILPAPELEDFNAALDLAMAGKNPEAIAKFEEFLNKYSSSALASDARKSLMILKRE